MYGTYFNKTHKNLNMNFQQEAMLRDIMIHYAI